MATSDPGQVADGHKEAKPSAWSQCDVDTLIAMREQGCSNADIGKKLGRQENAVAVKATRLHLPSRSADARREQIAQNPNAKLRPCLRCQKTFFSEGVGNRICDPCKSTSEWTTGSYSVSYGGSW